MNDDKKLWLLQKYEDGTFFLYHWTSMLAKKGYTVLTDEQAQPLIKLVAENKNNTSYLEEGGQGVKVTNQTVELIKVKPPVDAEVKSDSSIIEDVVSTDAEAPNLDEVRDICIEQEDIQAQDMAMVQGFKHKTQLEEFMLSKYQCEIPMGRLSTMKAFANNILVQLAKDNRLYTVDNIIKTD